MLGQIMCHVGIELSAATRTPGCSVNGCLCHLLRGAYVTFAELLLLLLVLSCQTAPMCLT